MMNQKSFKGEIASESGGKTCHYKPNVNSSSKINQKSKKNFKTSNSKSEKVLRAELDLNNNAGYSNFPFDDTEGYDEYYEMVERNMNILEGKKKKARVVIEELDRQQRSVAEEAVQRAIEIHKTGGQPDASTLGNFINGIASFFWCSRKGGNSPLAIPLNTFPEISDDTMRARRALYNRVKEMNKVPSEYGPDDFNWRKDVPRPKPKKDNVVRMTEEGEDSDDVFE